MTELPTYILQRRFKAPRSLVWKAWTTPELLVKWYGPGVESHVHELDVRPGGVWFGEMRYGGQSMFQRAEYLEVAEPERLVWLHSSADADGTVITNPMKENWPRVLHTTIELEAEGDQTLMTLTWVPHEASAAELACFEGEMANLNKGWGMGFDAMEALLEEMQAAV